MIFVGSLVESVLRVSLPLGAAYPESLEETAETSNEGGVAGCSAQAAPLLWKAAGGDTHASAGRPGALQED